MKNPLSCRAAFLGRARLISLLVAGLAAFSSGARSAVLLPGFKESRIATGLVLPTSLTVAPDGRLFVCEQGGRVRIVKSNTLLSSPFLTVWPDVSGERGLLGLAFDPDFDGSANRFVYIYYTAQTPTIHNRVSRFTASATNKDIVEPGSEQVILELPALGGVFRNGGDLLFGPDKTLYVSTGDNQLPSEAQSLTSLLGKILRINRDGTVPADNPYFTDTTGVFRSIYNLGLRNPFRIAIRRGSDLIHINDSGESSFEEIDRAYFGANHGWPLSEGTNPNPDAPIVYAYPRSSPGVCAITGGAFYDSEIVRFGFAWQNRYFFSDYCGGWIRYLDGAGGAADFATGIDSPVDLAVDRFGALYYLTRGAGGSVFKIERNTACSNAPIITEQPKSQTVAEGATATLTVKTADVGCPSSYQWSVIADGDSGDTIIPGATGSSLSVKATRDNRYFTYFVTVSNEIGFAVSQEVGLDVVIKGTITREAESLTRTSSGASTAIQTDANTSGGKWIALLADSTGDSVSFTVPSVPAGSYMIIMKYKAHPNRGVLDFVADGVSQGTLDQYSDTPFYGEQWFGPVTYSSTGNKTIRLRVVGKNAAAGAYTLSADAFKLEPR
jgi:glucose/arabinose dehydrogenase